MSVAISDGLGNQMFQYATGLAVAQRLGVPLRCDISSYQRNPNRQLALPSFGLRLEQPLEPTRWEKLWPPARARAVIDDAEFVPDVLTVKAPVRLEGWFQSWRYFEAIQHELRAAFDVERIGLGEAAGELLAQIRSTPMPVAVHVRRGDYRLLPKAFPMLDDEHYARARSRLEDVAAPRYFVFSDEPGAAAELVRDWPDTVLVNGLSAVEDFRLMASCRHFLIANSTFSWWAAWLGRSPDKRVIAPKLWFGEDFHRRVDIDARLPPEWLRV